MDSQLTPVYMKCYYYYYYSPSYGPSLAFTLH